MTAKAAPTSLTAAVADLDQAQADLRARIGEARTPKPRNRPSSTCSAPVLATSLPTPSPAVRRRSNTPPCGAWPRMTASRSRRSR